MIKVTLKTKEDYIKEIKIKGHSLHDDFGRDIVCAAVSSISITTVNAIESIDPKAIKYTDKNGLSIFVIKEDIIVNKLLNNMLNLLLELEHDYPENIKIL